METLLNPPGGKTSDFASYDDTIDDVDGTVVLVLPDDTTNGVIVKVDGPSAGYGRGQPFMVLKAGAGDADDQTAAGTVLMRIDDDGSIGTNGGLHIASGLRQAFGGAQAIWIDPEEDLVHIAMTAAPGTPVQPFVKITKNDGTTNVLTIDKEGALNVFRAGVGVGWFAGDNPPFGVRLGINAGATDVIPLLIGAAAGQTVDLMRVALGATVYAKFNKSGYFIIKKNAAPADADLAANELAIWFDNTDALPRVMFKGKTANGTVRSAAVAMA